MSRSGYWLIAASRLRLIVYISILHFGPVCPLMRKMNVHEVRYDTIRYIYVHSKADKLASLV